MSRRTNKEIDLFKGGCNGDDKVPYEIRSDRTLGVFDKSAVCDFGWRHRV